MMKYYKIVVNPNDETGVDFNAFVDVPAHMKGFIAFGKDQIRYSFNDEKRIVTGVMISTGTPIYRNSQDLGEHYVVFDAQTVALIRQKFFKNGFNQNLNTDHDPKKATKGATLIDSYLISSTDPKLPQAPEAFSHMNLQDGTWIASYHVEDDALWNDVKAGKFNGFSVEGWFEKQEIKIKTNMSKQTKSIWEMMFGVVKPKADKFSSATTADGKMLSYEGELAEGTALFVEAEDGSQLPAPEGDHQLTLEDGSVKIVTVDANGLVTAVADFVEQKEDDEDSMNAIRQEVADVMSKMAKDTNDRFEAIEKSNSELAEENKTLKAELEALKAQEKFQTNPKKTGSEERVSIAELVKKAK